MRKRGFTLIELMVVVLIVGILATAAVPSMQKTMNMNRATEAIGTMMQIAAAQKVCRVNNITSQSASCPGGEMSGSHNLIKEKYFPNRNWKNSLFKFAAAGGNEGSYTCSAGSYTSPAGASIEACTSSQISRFTNNYYADGGECIWGGGSKDYCPVF